MDQQAIIDELRARVAALEAIKPKQRVAYNQAETAARLGMSVSKLRSEMYAGRITGRKRGRTWVFTDTDLERYLAGPSD